MKDEDKVELYDNHLKLRGAILLSQANAETFRRSRPAATFEPDNERPGLLRVTRLRTAEA